MNSRAYRAWDKRHHRLSRVVSMESFGGETPTLTLEHSGTTYQLSLDDAVLTPSTGRTDREGEEIFVGDVMFNPYFGDLWEVRFDGETYNLHLIGDTYWFELDDVCGDEEHGGDDSIKWFIHGNVFERPELLGPSAVEWTDKYTQVMKRFVAQLKHSATSSTDRE